MFVAWPVLEVLEGTADCIVLFCVFILAFLGAVSDVAASRTCDGPFFHAHGATVDFIGPMAVFAVRCHLTLECLL